LRQSRKKLLGKKETHPIPSKISRNISVSTVFHPLEGNKTAATVALCSRVTYARAVVKKRLVYADIRIVAKTGSGHNMLRSET
jgi:hypothetical protein